MESLEPKRLNVRLCKNEITCWALPLPRGDSRVHALLAKGLYTLANSTITVLRYSLCMHFVMTVLRNWVMQVEHRSSFCQIIRHLILIPAQILPSNIAPRHLPCLGNCWLRSSSILALADRPPSSLSLIHLPFHATLQKVHSDYSRARLLQFASVMRVLAKCNQRDGATHCFLLPFLLLNLQLCIIRF